MDLSQNDCRESITRTFAFILTIREKWMISRQSWGYESFPFISVFSNSLQSCLVEADSIKPPQYLARLLRIKSNRRSQEHSCPSNSPINISRSFHEILVRRLTAVTMTNMDLRRKWMTYRGTENIRSLDKLLFRSTGSRVQPMGMMDYLVDVMSLQKAAIFGREEVYVQTSPFLFPPSRR
jgi:hypothetical protein